MKLTLKTKPANPPPSDAPATPQDSAGSQGPKLKFKLPAAAAADPSDGQTGDAPKAKRKYTKKVFLDTPGSETKSKSAPKKRAREDGGDVDPRASKRQPKPSAKRMSMAEDSDDDDEPIAQRLAPAAPRAPPTRTQSIKLSIKPKGGAPGAPQRTGTTLVKLKGAGKPPVRPPGVGYDSEADEAEGDPAIESQFILRMLPGSDCDLLRKAIEEKKIGVSATQGGPGVQFRFFDREGRRAMVTVQGRNYAASMVELPTVIETMKSWNKKDWVKTADVCQMLLVLGQVQNEDEAKKYPRPGFVDPDSHRFPHGITPPMHWARKLRFRPRKSYLDVERAEAQMNRLLVEDENSEQTKYELVDSDHDLSEDDSDSADEEDEEMMDAPDTMETPVEEVDVGDLEAMLHEGLMDDEDVEIQGDPQTINALLDKEIAAIEPATPTTAHEVALHALQQNGAITLETETAASTPAAATSADDDDDDDADSDDDEDDVDDEAVAEEQRKEQLRREIAELDEAIESSLANLQKHTNKLYKARLQTTIDKQKADRDIKRKQLGGDADLDE
ncbi:hypothetical protein CC86DRAFT_341658 [Ophiobolus disseminans]|uniref:TAFII55 protein conserved region domain-containing protein n=1 Tax=Ophiobolus disseminans TaxID=1469910 RepID=A0A6A7AEB8_9PLEO|nr:hypothetical protein CC86DRAFT_341658 [Ophiobolus disseminans]